MQSPLRSERLAEASTDSQGWALFAGVWDWRLAHSGSADRGIAALSALELDDDGGVTVYAAAAGSRVKEPMPC